MEKIKALFFAQYWGQNVAKDKDCIGHNYQFDVDADTFKDHLVADDESYLLLRSVSQLTKGELITLVNIYNNYYTSEIEPIDSIYFDIESGEIEYYYPNNSGCCTIQFCELPQPCTDWLKAIGILLSITYLDENNLPITLQPDEIIAKGWAKLTTD